MKPFFAYVWKRRWRRWMLYGSALFGFASLDPFFRQSIFGPKYDGIPWCAWADQFERYRERPPPWWFVQKLQEWGLLRLGKSAPLQIQW